MMKNLSNNVRTGLFILLISAVFNTPSPLIAEPPTDILTFAAFGDYGSNNQNEQAVADLVATLNPMVVVTTGDNSYGSTTIDDNIGQYYSDYIGNYAGVYGSGSPTNRFFPALGNHDWDDGGGVNAYLNYFTLPGATIPTSNTSGNERYYDFVQDPVHFFVLDSDINEPDGISSNSVQAQWLQTQLAASTAKWKVVVLHHSPFSSGSTHGSNPLLQWPFEAWGVTAVLSGHDHVYERILRDDNGDGTKMPYFVTGLGGRSRNAFATPETGSHVRYNDDYGTLFIIARPDQLNFTFYSVEGGMTLIDRYLIPQPVAFFPFIQTTSP